MEPDPDGWIENIRMLSDSASAVVPSDGTLDRVRAIRFVEPGFSPETWAKMLDLGWLGILVSEDAGGLGLGLRETVALCSVLGQGVVPEPFIPAVLGLGLLEKAGLWEELNAGLGGEVLLVAAWQASADGMDPRGGVVVADGRLSGNKIAVGGGMGADLFVVTTPEGVTLVPRGAAGLTVTPMQMHDGTFHAHLIFDEVPCDVHPCIGLDESLQDAMLLHAGYLLGVSDRAFAITLDYLRTRQQFDAPIGRFQALQHRATEIKVQLELTRAVIGAAASARDLGGDATRTHMAILRARARAAGLARLVAREAIQMHGAIGYTDEADIGLFVRKAMVEAGQFAPEYRLRKRFMDHWDAVMPDHVGTGCT